MVVAVAPGRGIMDVRAACADDLRTGNSPGECAFTMIKEGFSLNKKICQHLLLPVTLL